MKWLNLFAQCKLYFVRPHLDFCETTSRFWWRNLRWSLQRNISPEIESVQYNASLVLSGAIRGFSREKIYQELGLESLQRRHWFRKLSLFNKTFKENKPASLLNLKLTKIPSYNTRNTNEITLFPTKHNFFKNSFLRSTVIEWKKLDPHLWSAVSLNVF